MWFLLRHTKRVIRYRRTVRATFHNTGRFSGHLLASQPGGVAFLPVSFMFMGANTAYFHKYSNLHSFGKVGGGNGNKMSANKVGETLENRGFLY